MTYAAVPALRHAPDLARRYEPLLTSGTYDFGLRPPLEKTGILAGMSMTEKQGGSDVRANTTRAVPQPDGTYLLTGQQVVHQRADVRRLPGARAGAGRPDLLPAPAGPPGRLAEHDAPATAEGQTGQPLNASAEVEYEQAVAWRVGDEGRGVRTIIEMVNMTRLDCVIGGAAGLRQGVVQATHHAAHRKAFGRYLIDQPLMRNVLADLAVESEAATVLMLRLAGATDRGEAAFKRLALAVSKYWVSKRWPAHSAEALECLGGNGYVEESGMPRLFRESPLNSIWEGSGNVAALDVLRALVKEPETAEAFFTEAGLAAGADPRLDQAIREVKDSLADTTTIELRARRIVERLALVLQGSLLLRYGHPAVAHAFCASRLNRDWGQAFGTLPAGVDHDAIIARATPKLG